MRCCKRTKAGRRRGYTLLEVLLATGIAAVLMAGVYTATMMHYQQLAIGRDVADDAQLMRSLAQRIRADVSATLTTWVSPQIPQSSGTASGASGSPASSTGAAAGGAAASGSTAGSSSSSSGSGSTDTSGFPPGGVLGSEDNLSLVVRTLPIDLDFSPNAASTSAATLFRTVVYHLGTPAGASGADQGRFGLLRDELLQTPNGAVQLDVTLGGRSELVAPEVEGVRFQYYDGSNWLSTWDATQTSPPIAIEINLGLRMRRPPAGQSSADGLTWIRLVAALPNIDLSSVGANASTSSSSSGGSSTSSGSSGSSSSGSGS